MRTKTELEALTGLPFRDALAEVESVPFELLAEGRRSDVPLLTIAIPTFQRLELLFEAVESVLAQDMLDRVEVLIIDDDPISTHAEPLLRRCARLRDLTFRYVRNTRNLGLYPNHNRGIQLARGKWLAFLNDDDLLTPDFVATMLGVVHRHSSIQALIPRKIIFDQRVANREPPRSWVWRAAKRVLLEWTFLGRYSRPIRLRKFFWGAVLGGSGGVLFRRDRLTEIGGFYPEEHPASDLWLFARYAALFNLFHCRGETIRIRIANNESAKPATVRRGLYWGHRLQEWMIGREVPRWYRHILPLLLEQHRAEFRDFWRTEVSKPELEQLLHVRLPRENRVLIRAVQTVLRGF